MLCRFAAASRMAPISACAVGSSVAHTWLWLAATTSSCVTMTAPNGDCPAAMPARAAVIACSMRASSSHLMELEVPRREPQLRKPPDPHRVIDVNASGVLDPDGQPQQPRGGELQLDV